MPTEEVLREDARTESWQDRIVEAVSEIEPLINPNIKFEEDYPYNPITDFGIIDTKIDFFLSNEQFEDCANYIDSDVKKKLEDFHNHYNKQEVRHIVENLQSTSQRVYPNLPDTTDAKYLKLEIEDVIEEFA